MSQRAAVLDLSHWQPRVSMSEVKASGIVGVILKATEGHTNTDPTFKRRYKAALDAGLEVATYHFLRDRDIPGQVERYLDTVQPRPGELVFLDHEDAKVSLGELLAGVSAIQTLRPDVRVGIYSGHLIKQQLGDARNEALAETELWLAQYTKGAPRWPEETWPEWSLWQYTDKGENPGVTGLCDLNQFNGSDGACRRWMSAGHPDLIVDVPTEPPVAARPVVSISAEGEVDIVVNGVRII
jgi:lysozyme